MIYQWKESSIFAKHDADKIGNHLDQLRNKLNGLTVRDVVKDASDKTNPTHNCFEWDNNKAGDKYRLHQARLLLDNIVRIKIQDKELSTPIRAFYSIKRDDRQTDYTPIHVVLNSEYDRQQVLQTALREVTNWKKRYESLEELTKVFKAIEEAKEEFISTQIV